MGPVPVAGTRLGYVRSNPENTASHQRRVSDLHRQALADLMHLRRNSGPESRKYGGSEGASRAAARGNHLMAERWIHRGIVTLV
jgi:hypothetical protein